MSFAPGLHGRRSPASVRWALVALGIASFSTRSADAAIVAGAMDFQGAAQTFAATLIASGSFTISGSANYNGLPLTIPNQTKPISLQGGSATFNSNPMGTGLMTYDNVTPAPAGIEDLVLNMQNGVDWDVTFNTITINARIAGIIPFDINIDLSAVISGLTFNQDPGFAAANPTFAAPGAMAGTLSASANVTLAGAFDLPPTPLSFPMAVPGTAAVFNNAPDFLGQLSGALPDQSIPVAFSQNFVDTDPSDNITYNINFALDAALNLNGLAYNLQSNLAAVPEPSSVGLVVIAGLGAFAARRLRQRTDA